MKPKRDSFSMKFHMGTLRHLGIKMYSTLPPVLAELVSNAYDGGATEVRITLPLDASANAVITVKDNGFGMSHEQIQNHYLVVGRDRREDESDEIIAKNGRNRKVMGRKGIGKFAPLGVAEEIEIESCDQDQTARLIMSFDEFERHKGKGIITLPNLKPTGQVKEGTCVTLRTLKRRTFDLTSLKKGLARRFSVFGEANGFQIFINNEELTLADRDMRSDLEEDDTGVYLWEYDEEIVPESGWRVTGWIGTLKNTVRSISEEERGVVIMARGKMAQEPFFFNSPIGQQFGFSYIVGEINAEFIDDTADTIGTTRNSLVWDEPCNKALLEWGAKKINDVARTWAAKRSAHNEKILRLNPIYEEFKKYTEQLDKSSLVTLADNFIKRQVKNPALSTEELVEVVTFARDYLNYDIFQQLALDIESTGASHNEVQNLIQLFRKWEIVEAKEMARVTNGRIKTIEKLQQFIKEDALEVPTLHNFLKQFPWVLDARWTLVQDEIRYSQLLRDNFVESNDTAEIDKRIDFLCVKENRTLVVVEIKRPSNTASFKELGQIEEYVRWIRVQNRKISDPDARYDNIVGYLLTGRIVKNDEVEEKMKSLMLDNIFVRPYSALVEQVKNYHKEFLDRYKELEERVSNKS